MGKKVVGAGEKGSAHMLLLSFVFLATAVLLFRFHYQKNMIRSLYEYLDDGLTVSLMAAGVINQGEYGRSRQIVIHGNLPDSLFEEAEGVEGGDEGEEETEEGGTNEQEQPRTIPIIDCGEIVKLDETVKGSLQIFEDALKTNLMLDDSFHSKQPIIVSPIEVKKYTVFNVFRNIDTMGAFTGESIICRYDYENGVWSAAGLGSAGTTGIGTSTLVDEGYLTIQNTSVFAELTFDLLVMPYSSLYFPEGMEAEEGIKRVSYSRAVDITVKN